MTDEDDLTDALTALNELHEVEVFNAYVTGYLAALEDMEDNG